MGDHIKRARELAEKPVPLPQPPSQRVPFPSPVAHSFLTDAVYLGNGKWRVVDKAAELRAWQAEHAAFYKEQVANLQQQLDDYVHWVQRPFVLPAEEA